MISLANDGHDTRVRYTEMAHARFEFLEGLKHPEVIRYAFAGALPDIQSET